MASARLRIRDGVELGAEAGMTSRDSGFRSRYGKRGCRLDYPHHVQVQISPLTNAQEIDELPPWGNEDVYVKDIGVDPAHHVANVGLSAAYARSMAVEADPDPRRAVSTPVRAVHAAVLIGGHDGKSAPVTGGLE